MFERFKEDAGRGLSEFTDSDHSRRTYLWMMAAGLAVNLLSWIVALITPETIAGWVGLVADLSNRVKAFLLAFPFWSTFAAAYAALRLPRYSSTTAAIGDDDLMASFRDTERNSYLRSRILLALAAAALNVIFLVVALIWFG